MASDKDFVEYVLSQIDLPNEVRVRKMFGEYAVYYKHKVVALICDNKFMVKITTAGKDILKNYKLDIPYSGAKECFFLDEELEDSELLSQLIVSTFDELPEPKLKKKKT